MKSEGRSSKTILIVEDEAIIAEQLRDTLENLGYAVPSPIRSGREAIDSAEKEHPDLVLMDIKLDGDIDGIDAAQEINNRFNIPVIYLTAYKDDLTVERAKQTGPFGFVIKPFNERELDANIQMALQRHELENRIRESEEKYRDLVENINDLIYSVDVDGIITYVSPVVEKLYGYRQNEVLGRRFVDFIHEDDREGMTQRFRRALDGNVDENEYRLITRSGEIRWFFTHNRPIFFEGEPNGLRGVLTDITDRKRTEDALRESEAKFRLFYENAPVSYQSLDEEGTILYVNPTWLETLGYDEEEVIGRWFGDFLEPGFIKRFKKEYRKFKQEGKIYGVEYVLIRKDGSEIIAAYDGRIGCTLDGSFERAHCIFHNITEQKKHEADLRRSREEMRNLSQHLESIREEERTRIAREIHDELGQALTALKMDIVWLNRRIVDEEVINREKTASMIELVDDTIQSVRRISSELRPGILDDLGLAAAIEWQTGEIEKRTGICCEASFEPEDIMIDDTCNISVFRIFQEAITNVIRHANASKVQVRLHMDDTTLELCVHDDGIGITEDSISNSNSFGLIGMRERALFCGGELHIFRNPDKGTTVKVTIPLSR
jgi:PAS domain S-box-containing protein